jgi:alpha-beta hydrolase superfamily lysophospholipase
MTTYSTLPTADGLDLAVEHHRVANPHARLVIVHGYAEHKGRYGELVAALTAARYECHLLDLRGHGASGGRRGHVSEVAEYRSDLDRFVETVRAGSDPGTPLLLVGHSLGGLISLDYVLHHPEAFAALAVGSPYLAPAFEIPAFKKTLGTLAANVVPTFALESGLKPEWLSHDPQVVRAYAEDPLVFSKTTLGWFTAVEAAQDEVFARAGEIRLPILMMAGSGDQIADHRRTREVFERLGSADKRLKIYDGLFHELFNEVDRARVVSDLLAWLAARTPA